MKEKTTCSISYIYEFKKNNVVILKIENKVCIYIYLNIIVYYIIFFFLNLLAMQYFVYGSHWIPNYYRNIMFRIYFVTNLEVRIIW